LSPFLSARSLLDHASVSVCEPNVLVGIDGSVIDEGAVFPSLRHQPDRYRSLGQHFELVDILVELCEWLGGAYLPVIVIVQFCDLSILNVEVSSFLPVDN
jgi:hypothetical protein